MVRVPPGQQGEVGNEEARGPRLAGDPRITRGLGGDANHDDVEDAKVCGVLDWLFTSNVRCSNRLSPLRPLRAGARAPSPKPQRAPDARLLHNPAARIPQPNCCPAQASPGFTGRLLPHPHPHRFARRVCRPSPCTGQGFSHVPRQRPRKGAPCRRYRLPLPSTASPLH